MIYSNTFDVTIKLSVDLRLTFIQLTRDLRFDFFVIVLDKMAVQLRTDAHQKVEKRKETQNIHKETCELKQFHLPMSFLKLPTLSLCMLTFALWLDDGQTIWDLSHNAHPK